MANRYLDLDGAEQIRNSYELIPEAFDGVESDIDAAAGISEGIQAEVTEHKDSATAHAAEHITYDGPVAGAGNMKAAVDSVKQQLDTAVMSGDSSVAAAQAAIDVEGFEHPSLKARIDSDVVHLSTQLAEKASVEEVSTKADQTYVNSELATKRDKFTEIDMPDLSTAVKTAMTGGAVAVVGLDSVGRENLKNRSTTLGKLNDDVTTFGGYKASVVFSTGTSFGILVTCDIRSINLVGKTVSFSFKFNYPGTNVANVRSRFRLSDDPIAQVNLQNPFSGSNDGPLVVPDSKSVYLYEDNGRVGVLDGNYLQTLIWVTLNSSSSTDTIYIGSPIITIDGVVTPTQIYARQGNTLTLTVAERLPFQLVTEQVLGTKVDQKITDAVNGPIMEVRLDKLQQDFSSFPGGKLANVTGFNNSYFAVRMAYDLTGVPLTGSILDFDFTFNAPGVNATEIQARYRLSDSMTELVNPQNPFAESNGHLLSVDHSKIQSYSEHGKVGLLEGPYLFVYMWVVLSEISNADRLYYSNHSVKINGASRTPVAVSVHSGTLSLSDVSSLPKQFLTNEGKYQTEITRYNSMKWAFIGDSITNSTGGFTTKYWHQFVNDELQFAQVYNYGIGGSTIGKKDGGTANAPMIDRYASMADDADFISVFGGTNDYSRDVALGTFDSRDNATFYGAYHNLLLGLINKYPGKRLFVMTPLPRLVDEPRVSPNGLSDYINAIREVAAFYSVPVLDLNKMSGLYPKSEAFSALCMADGVHPNVEGHKLFTNKVLNFVKSL